MFCDEKQVRPVKFNMYRKVFKTELNIAFIEPKNDRSDLCEEYEAAQKNKNVNEYLINTIKQHNESKIATMEERQHDRESKMPVLCFDLENVITVP